MLKRAIRITAYFLGGFVLLFIAWAAWGFYTMDDTFKEEQEYFGDLKGIEYEFRGAFHGKTDYQAMTLEDLVRRGTIDKNTLDLIKAYGGKFTPFSSTTPENAVVLRFNNFLFEPDIFTKRDLTADNNAPDHFVEKN